MKNIDFTPGGVGCIAWLGVLVTGGINRVKTLYLQSAGKQLLIACSKPRVGPLNGVTALRETVNNEAVFAGDCEASETRSNNPMGGMARVTNGVRPRIGKIGWMRELIEDAKMQEECPRITIVTNLDELCALVDQWIVHHALRSTPNENKISDAYRERASIGVEMV